MKQSKDSYENVLKWIDRAAAKEANRPVLTWAVVQSDCIASANGFALHIAYGDYTERANANGFIPLKKSVPDGDKGHFPDFKCLVPTKFSHELSFSVGQMTQAVKAARVFGRDNNEKIVLILAPNEGLIGVYGYSAEHGDCISHVASPRIGALQPLAVALNAEFVLNALSGWDDTDTISLKANSHNNAVVIGTDSKLALIMPMPLCRDYIQKWDAEIAAATAEYLKLLDYDMPRAYNPPKTWAELHPVKPMVSAADKLEAKQRKARAAARVVADYTTERRGMSYAEKSAGVPTIFTLSGSRIAADVQTGENLATGSLVVYHKAEDTYWDKVKLVNVLAVDKPTPVQPVKPLEPLAEKLADYVSDLLGEFSSSDGVLAVRKESHGLTFYSHKDQSNGALMHRTRIETVGNLTRWLEEWRTSELAGWKRNSGGEQATALNWNEFGAALRARLPDRARMLVLNAAQIAGKELA